MAGKSIISRARTPLPVRGSTVWRLFRSPASGVVAAHTLSQAPVVAGQRGNFTPRGVVRAAAGVLARSEAGPVHPSASDTRAAVEWGSRHAGVEFAPI
ncbi:hypothetical protein JCM9533A_53520 [Catenuloplanes niger JCM 9533]|uniref:Uncharacterized protein n=1 Tax=Catenuloplanes niger TaxID=587534 RepID=A0AAE4CS47_9ACTN|nr:hypothetical protein [Catenuloplanes niger]